MPLIPTVLLVGWRLQNIPRHSSEEMVARVLTHATELSISYKTDFLHFSSMSWKLPIYSGKWIPEEVVVALDKILSIFEITS